MRNYTLYFKIGSSMLPILKGTLKEIDDFTTEFRNEDELGEFVIKNYESSKYNCFVLKSSKNNEYKVLFSFFRSATITENSDLIINYLKNQSREYLLSFLEKYTKILEYIRTGENLSRVPLYKLYNAVYQNDPGSILYELNKFAKQDYKNFRQLMIGIIIENEEIPFIKSSPSKEGKMEKFQKIKFYKQVDYSDFIPEDAKEDITEQNSLDDDIWNILNNENMDIDEKMTELSFIVDDADDFRECIAKNYALISKE